MVQEFVKHSTSKLNRKVEKINTNFNALGKLDSNSKDLRGSSELKNSRIRGDSVSPNRQDNATPQDVLGSYSHGAIVEIIEEALKWRV